MSKLYKVKISHPIVHYISEHFTYVVIDDNVCLDMVKQCMVIDIDNMNFYTLGTGLVEDLDKIETVSELKAVIRERKLDNCIED